MRKYFITTAPYKISINGSVIDIDDIQIMMLIMMIIVVSIEIGYILWRRKKRESEMRFKKKQKGETLSEKAHNLIITTESISSTLAAQGVATFNADSLLKEAKDYRARGDYSAAIERAETAKLALLRAKREHTVPGTVQPVPDPSETEMSPVMAPETEDIEMAHAPGESVDKSKLPDNYMQAKFMISTIKDQLDEKGMEDGEGGSSKKEAVSFFKKAKKYFKNEEYSKALSYAIKAERLLDTETLGLIGEEEIVHRDDVEVEEMTCPSCEDEVTLEDAFCRKCGEKLEFQTLCPNCEAEINSDDQFCRKCGQHLSDTDQ